MSQIMKAFMGIFLFMLLVVTATGMLGAFLEVSHAQNLHASMIDEIENSHYAKPVLEECFTVAKKSSYSLQIDLYMRNGGMVSCTRSNQLPKSMEDVIFAKVVLSYPFRILFFDIELWQEIFGYAR